ncbi:hypothetical protein [Rhizobium ruizarguesonis]|uniref:hypothetical protein n=1 Tax=Rhizobium ruizarguesonis TaxID=2081791 RepID=UPI001030C615|nr:hypothetical protein [Rhizobium ruizarguesonis]TAY72816.1 hypothetical protein ELH84_02400 [Rhizobium ruizarguesonis]
MIDVANLRPSDIETFMDEGFSPEAKQGILEGLKRLLSEVRPDGGADSDRIHMTADMLAMAGAWKEIDAHDLALAIVGTNDLNIKDFIEGLPDSYAREVAFHLVTSVGPFEEGADLLRRLVEPGAKTYATAAAAFAGVHLSLAGAGGVVAGGPALYAGGPVLYAVDPLGRVVISERGHAVPGYDYGLRLPIEHVISTPADVSLARGQRGSPAKPPRKRHKMTP